MKTHAPPLNVWRAGNPFIIMFNAEDGGKSNGNLDASPKSPPKDLFLTAKYAKYANPESFQRDRF